MQRYGETATEKDAQKSLQCRQIVSEISKFGVDQAQLLQIIELLAMELEERDAMVRISELARELRRGPVKGNTLLMPGEENDE